MLFFCVPETEKESANKFIKDNLNPTAQDSFVVNRIDEATKLSYCLLSIPDDNSSFAEGMKKQFGYTDYLKEAYNSRKITQAQAVKTEMIAKVPGFLGIGTKNEVVDRIDFVSSLKTIEQDIHIPAGEVFVELP
jgi:hypothetical protein